MIKFQTEKIIGSDGKKMRHILDVKMLEKQDVPKLYTETGACCYLAGLGTRRVVLKGTNKMPAPVDYFVFPCYMDEDTFQKVKEFVDYCGERLLRVNKRLKKLEQNWSGKETIKI